MKTRQKSPRIAILPFDECGNSSNLQSGFIDLGFEVELWTFEGGKSDGYPIRRIYPNRQSYVQTEIRRLAFLLRLLTFDVVVYTFGSTLFAPKYFSQVEGGRLRWGFIFKVINGYFSMMQLVELHALRVLGRHVVVIFQGSDARVVQEFSRLRGLNYASLTGEEMSFTERDRIRRQNISRLSRLSTKLYALNPDLLNFLPHGDFMPYAFGGPNPGRIAGRQLGSPIRIGHAPSKRLVKGTADILEAIKSLQDSKEFDVELVLIENLPHSEALTLYDTLDFMVDQVNIGWFGVLAVECAALGVPTIASLHDDDLELINRKYRAEMAVINAKRENLAEVLSGLCSLSQEEYTSLSLKALQFALNHRPKVVATQIVTDLRIVSGSDSLQ